MLLRSISKHVKDQNWFAVVLDFVIVVLGVYLGVQVANWNAETQDQSLDQSYMLRLHDEIEFAESRMREVYNELETTVRYVNEAIAILHGVDKAGALSQNQCDAVFASHIYRPTSVSIPTLEELLSSGRAAILSDKALRTAILELTQLQAATRAQRQSVQSAGQDSNLGIKFSAMINLNPELEFNRYGFAPIGGHLCDYQQMRESHAFKNALIDNMYRMSSFVMLTFGPERDQLSTVHSLLDDRLEMNHTNQSADK